MAACAATLIFSVYVAPGQSTLRLSEGSKPVIRSTSRLVVVSTLVRTDSGELANDLDASLFRLTDNGIEQNVSVERVENEPLAVVVLMQTGGAASNYLQNYKKLDSTLETVLGSSTRKVALVTFDSRPEQIWPFPERVDALYYFLRRPENGDHGAAILDAVNCAMGLLQLQPPDFRRIIILLSQAQDLGSATHAEDVVKRLAESGTTVYSLTFSPEEKLVNRHLRNPARAHASQGNAHSRDTANFSSFGQALKAMRESTAAELAALSGGEQGKFHDEDDLESKFSILTDDIHNGYTLSFYPTSEEAGLHNVAVRVLEEKPGLRVMAREIYWVDEPSAEK
jgi:VWFA-related protein